jgi:hypothetical protein
VAHRPSAVPVKWYYEIHGTDYDIAHHIIKAVMTDTPLCLWNKGPVHVDNTFKPRGFFLCRQGFFVLRSVMRLL